MEVKFHNVNAIKMSKKFYPVTDKSHSTEDFWNIDIIVYIDDERHTISFISDKEITLE